MKPQPLSVVIITRNAAEVLEPCLQSVCFADEILVIDSGSTDQTENIAQDMGARVIQQPWLGFGPQKRFGVEQAIHPWVLCLDADERVSSILQKSIQDELMAPRKRAFQMPRCNRFMGRWLRHGEGYPDLNLRLFHRDFGQWTEDTIHEKVVVTGEVGLLHGDLLHESAQTLHAYLEKQNHYTTLQAKRLIQSQHRISGFRMITSPLLRFIKFYVLRLGFLDGLPGFVHISIGCFSSYIKYAKAYGEQQETGGLPPK